MKALLIIDMQNDFMPGGSLAIPKANEIILIINKLMDHFDNVYVTKDLHPKNHVSFASSHNKKVGDLLLVNNTMQRLWPDHCVQNTKGAELATGINTKKIKKIFNKGLDKNVDSYSAFFDNNQKKATALDDYLKESNITELYMVGVATDYCVMFSAIDAVKLGFKVYLIKDGCMPVDKNNEAQVLLGLGNKSIHIISSSDIFTY